MLDIGFMEIFVIGALALIVVGPKDLPGLLRTVGQFVAKARGMARDFQRTMEDAAKDADLGDVADVMKGKGNLNKLPFDNQIVDSMKEFERSVKAGVGDAKTEFDKPSASSAKVEAAPTTASPAKTEVATPIPAAPAPKAAKASPAKKPAVKKAAGPKKAPVTKTAAAKPKAATKVKPTPEKSA